MKKSLKFKLIISSLLLTISATSLATSPKAKKPASNWNMGSTLEASKDKSPNTIDLSTYKRTGPTIQIALLLDTSTSMDNLIGQAKSKLWTIVNELGEANKNKENVSIQVGIIEYGKSTIPREEGFLRVVSPLSGDLDIISQKLFSLGTNGGEEYAGKAINAARNRLAWSPHPDDLKIIIIAGNESFAQGDIGYQYAIDHAVSNDIIVNTIFCGDYQQGRIYKWKDGANRGNGKYMNINLDKTIVEIPTPYDDQIIALNSQLNKTYRGFGKKGRLRMELQAEQDQNSSITGISSAVNRAIAKSSKQYSNKSWDIVDAVKNNSDALEDLSDTELPEEMRKMDMDEKKRYVKSIEKERVRVQGEIKELERKRKIYIAKKEGENQNNNLDDQIINAVKAQAMGKGYDF